MLLDGFLKHSIAGNVGRGGAAFLQGDGDDFGVFVTISHSAGITVGLHLHSGESAGRDAGAIVRILTAMPGFRSFSALERPKTSDVRH